MILLRSGPTLKGLNEYYWLNQWNNGMVDAVQTISTELIKLIITICWQVELRDCTISIKLQNYCKSKIVENTWRFVEHYNALWICCTLSWNLLHLSIKWNSRHIPSYINIRIIILIKINGAKDWLWLSEQMDVCNLLVDVQKITI